MKPIHPLLQKAGLHPLVAFAVISIDCMLFAEDAALGPIGWFISSLVALVLIFPCILLQRLAYHDRWSIAIAKGLIIGILTAIPTALPSFVTAAGGILGAIGMLTNRQQPAVPPEHPDDQPPIAKS